MFKKRVDLKFLQNIANDLIVKIQLLNSEAACPFTSVVQKSLLLFPLHQTSYVNPRSDLMFFSLAVKYKIFSFFRVLPSLHIIIQRFHAPCALPPVPP